MFWAGRRGAGQANLMQGRFGASCEGAPLVAEVTGTGGVADSTMGFAAQANEMHRFFGASSFGGCSVLGVASPCTCRSITGPSRNRFFSRSERFRRSGSMSGRRGLGEFVRDGLVNPVSHVNSAVEAKLTLLVIDRRRPRSARLGRVSVLSSSWLCRAFVSKDAWVSVALRTAVLWKELLSPETGRHGSGGSSASALASSSATGILADCPDHANTLDVAASCLSCVMVESYTRDTVEQGS